MPIQIANEAKILCPQKHCVDYGAMLDTLYTCGECGQIMCKACLEAHEAEGHWSDSDTAAQMYSGLGVA